jgi:Zn ribbon nucleic-acid-binding protein
MKDIIGNCPLCEERALHVAGTEDAQVMQCINCGYTTSTKFRGIKADNEEFQKLGEDMKNWAKEENGHIWIPSIITLPIGMLYPVNIKKEMKWAFAPMVEIPEEERKKYPNPSIPGKFYDKKVDTHNSKLYDEFIVGMSEINNLLKQKVENGTEETTL